MFQLSEYLPSQHPRMAGDDLLHLEWGVEGASSGVATFGTLAIGLRRAYSVRKSIGSS